MSGRFLHLFASGGFVGRAIRLVVHALEENLKEIAVMLTARRASQREGRGAEESLASLPSDHLSKRDCCDQKVKRGYALHRGQRFSASKFKEDLQGEPGRLDESSSMRGDHAEGG